MGAAGFIGQLLISGLAIGSIYALVALGFVIIYRAVNVVNFAQGEFSMVAAFLFTVFLQEMNVPYGWSFVLVILGMALFGILFELSVYFPLRNRSFLPVVISTIGASIFLQNISLAVFGPYPRQVSPAFSTEALNIGPVVLSSQSMLILGLTLLLMLLQYIFFEKTMLGKKLQATAQDQAMASMLGINISLMVAITFMYSAVLGGVAGLLVAPLFFVNTSMGTVIALKSFAASIIGGFGSIPGAIVGGLLIGIIENFGAAYISASYRDAYAFLALAIFLLSRPQGIFGEQISEKA